MDAPLPADPVLTDGVVTLRRHRAEDVPGVLAQCEDPETQRWTTVPVPYTRAHAEDFVRRTVVEAWAEGRVASLAIVSAGRFAGTVDLRLQGDGRAGIGFGLAPWARGRGLMSRAVRLAVGWAFDELGVRVVHWQAHLGNWESRRVAWATGFRVEGAVRGLLVQRGRLLDGWIGSLWRGEELRPRTPWFDVPVVVGPRVVLRPWREDDAPRVAEACDDAGSQRWLPQLPSPYTLEDAQAFLGSREGEHAAGRGVYWCAAAPDDDRCLASVTVMVGSPSAQSGEIGYWAHPDARGRGVTTEAVRLAARHALLPLDDGGLGLHRVLIRAAAGNRASRAVAERAGFTETGRDREAELLRDGTREDFVRFDLLARELDEPDDLDQPGEARSD